MGFLWILGRSSLIFILFWVSIVLMSFGGGGWVVLGGWWDLRFGGGALASSMRLCGCICVGVFVFVCIKEEENDESEFF